MISATRFLALAAVSIAAGAAPAAAQDGATGGLLPAQPAVALTLDEAGRRAVENNPDLAVVRPDTEADAARGLASRRALAPVVSPQGGRSRISPPAPTRRSTSASSVTAARSSPAA